VSTFCLEARDIPTDVGERADSLDCAGDDDGFGELEVAVLEGEGLEVLSRGNLKHNRRGHGRCPRSHSLPMRMCPGVE
jgi:hypothetical protein